MNLLDMLYGPLAAVTAPVWARRARGGWPERFGRVIAPPPPEHGRRRLMLHAVSVGEVNAVRGLVPLLWPRCEVVVTTTTDTGLARARALFSPLIGAERVLRYPLDFSASVRRFLDAARPDAVALVELELWPNFIAECRRRAIPVGVINGRLSKRSFKGYRRFRGFFRRAFGALRFAAVQDESYATRFAHMGVPGERISVTGSMKWDSVQPGIDRDLRTQADGLAEALGIDRSRPLIVAGSTGPSEEQMLEACCPPGAQLLCAPRRPERFDEAFAALGGDGRCVRRSRASTVSGPRAGLDRFLLDSIGELRAAYALATVVVVGRSFGRLHGSDPIEPIALGVPTVIGPSHGDFQSIVDAFGRAGAIVVAERTTLKETLAGLLADRERRSALVERGVRAIAENQGATARHAGLLLDQLGVRAE